MSNEHASDCRWRTIKIRKCLFLKLVVRRCRDRLRKLVSAARTANESKIVHSNEATCEAMQSLLRANGFGCDAVELIVCYSRIPEAANNET